MHMHQEFEFEHKCSPRPARVSLVLELERAARVCTPLNTSLSDVGCVVRSDAILTRKLAERVKKTAAAVGHLLVARRVQYAYLEILTYAWSQMTF